MLHPTVWEVSVLLSDVIVSRDFPVYYNPLSSLNCRVAAGSFILLFSGTF
jgi:hypothetical protein